jgi:hypothetical protein
MALWKAPTARADRQAQMSRNVDSAQQMVLRDHFIEPKFVEQARLLSMPSPHHCRIILRSFSQQESPFTTSRKPFFDSIVPKVTPARRLFPV